MVPTISTPVAPPPQTVTERTSRRALAVDRRAAALSCVAMRRCNSCASATDHIVTACSASPGTGGRCGTAPLHTTARQYSISWSPPMPITRRCGSMVSTRLKHVRTGRSLSTAGNQSSQNSGRSGPTATRSSSESACWQGFGSTSRTSASRSRRSRRARPRRTASVVPAYPPPTMTTLRPGPSPVAQGPDCSIVSMRLQSVPMHSCPKRRRWE